MFVPGDRFREIYYWDTHWVVKGLLVCNMLSSAEQQVRNLLFLADIYGHVPNGNRTYYINRRSVGMLMGFKPKMYMLNCDPPYGLWIHGILVLTSHQPGDKILHGKRVNNLYSSLFQPATST